MAKLLKQSCNYVLRSSRSTLKIYFQQNRLLSLAVKIDEAEIKQSKYSRNLAAVMHGIKNLKIESRTIPKPSPNQVLLQIEAVGINESDVNFYMNGKIGHTKFDGPIVVGHEASGTVLECGTDVETLKPGDRVAIEPQIGCGKCDLCKAGRYQLCSKLTLFGQPPTDGMICTYHVHDADYCYRLPRPLDLEQGALTQPLAVAIHACNRANIKGCDVVLISASDSVGLLVLMAAKAFGAIDTLYVDTDDYRIQRSKELGASYTINIKGMTHTDLANAILNITGYLPNKTIECSGLTSSMILCAYSTETFGRLVLVERRHFRSDIILPIHECISREIEVLGSTRSCNEFDQALNMMRTLALDPRNLITHRFKIEDTGKAFDLASKKSENFLKIMIHCNPQYKPAS